MAAETNVAVVGVAGLLRSVELGSRKTDISEAFTDLDALMKTADDLVKLAQTMLNKLGGGGEEGGEERGGGGWDRTESR